MRFEPSGQSQVMPNAEIAVYQAEWCPYSSQVRQKLTELNVPYVAVPVPADKQDRTELCERFGTDEIPVVVLDDGTVLKGRTEDIVRDLEGRFSASGDFAGAHQRQAAAH